MAEPRLGRSYSIVATFAPPMAALLVVVATWMSEGYDPVVRTVSRLAVPGMPAAALVDAAACLVALACFALALRLRGAASAGRVSLVVAGVAFLATAVVHLDPQSQAATATHRVASGLAILALTAAPLILARDYGPLCVVAGAAEVAMLALAPALVATPFDAWGAWERVVLGIPLAWMVILAATSVSTQETLRALSATVNSSG